MSFFEILKLVFPLFLIVTLLYGLLLLVKKYQFKGNKLNSSNLRIVTTMMLMPKKYLSVVKVNQKVLILGVSEQSITLLKEMNADEFNLNDDNQSQHNPDFLEVFKKMIRQ
ncbi:MULTISPECIES: flagellar biosynthetic protein FliO [Ignavibacterium]|uniref:flagellar biosynthetic protein FliO n=1 Tax=Ignavibacterium TaxID=795750 RepID=UPI0025BF09CD|nr:MULTISPECIES: flagellar biosynthetic protein FliO [Ignavibacterium]MBI5662686.1 flagellar biosynthetic protein FliO [Ignavibacterium album]